MCRRFRSRCLGLLNNETIKAFIIQQSDSLDPITKACCFKLIDMKSQFESESIGKETIYEVQQLVETFLRTTYGQKNKQPKEQQPTEGIQITNNNRPFMYLFVFLH